MNKPLNIYPENWETTTLKETANYFIDGDWIESEFIDNEGTRIIQTGNIGIGEYIDKPGTSKFINNESFKKLNCKKVFPGDVLICRLADPIGRCCIVPNTQKYYVTAVDVAIYRPKSNINKEFISYLLNSNEKLRQMADKAGGSTRQRISRTNLGNISITIPNLFKEQEKISSILSTIDLSIKKTEQLISKYKSIKQGLMQDLFRYGIDENGQIRSEKTHKFKNSPLGRIPEGWEVSELKPLCERIIVGLATTVTNYYRNEGVPIIRNQNIRKGYFDGDDILYLDEKFAKKYPNKTCKKNDVLICHTGSNVGDTCLLPDAFINSHTFTTLIITTKNSVLEPNYLVLYMNSTTGIKEMEMMLLGGAKNNLNVGQLVDLRVKFPKDTQEQNRIIFILTGIEESISKEDSLLKKLDLLKQGLMQDLLTGKVRVNHLIN